MHENERHRLILSVLNERPMATVRELVELTKSSEATVRRDIGALDRQRKLRRMRGGAEAIEPPPQPELAGRSFAMNRGVNVGKKRAIARRGGRDVLGRRVHHHQRRDDHLPDGALPRVPEASDPDQLVPDRGPPARHSKNTVILPGGTVYREQNIILSPFANDGSRHFSARRMFMGAQGVGPHGVTEADPLVIQAEEKLIGQAEELVVLVNSSKFLRHCEPGAVRASSGFRRSSPTTRCPTRRARWSGRRGRDDRRCRCAAGMTPRRADPPPSSTSARPPRSSPWSTVQRARRWTR